MKRQRIIVKADGTFVPVHTAKNFWGEKLSGINTEDERKAAWESLSPEQKAIRRAEKIIREQERKARRAEKQALWEEACRRVEARKIAEREMIESMTSDRFYATA